MSNRTKLLVTYQDVYTRTRIENGVESTTLYPIMIMAQEVVLQSVLGTSLYDYLLTQRTSVGTFSGITSSIMTEFIEDYMQPALLAYITEEFINSNSIKLSNVGIQQEKDGAGDARLTEAIANAKNTSNAYSVRMRRYICNSDNWSTFSEYYDDCQDNVMPQTMLMRGGVVVPQAGMSLNKPFKKYKL